MMDADTTCLSAVSLHLSRTLDEIGLNSVTVKRRRETFLISEQLWTWKERLRERNISTYCFGSQTEGATTLGLNSDIDVLNCFDDYNVMQDWAEWQRGKKNILMLQENTEPGYCRLQWPGPDIAEAREDLPSEHCTYDDRGRVLLKNTGFYIEREGRSRNGPALSLAGTHACTSTDSVGAYKCNSWPVQAKEFTRRLRRHGWPSQRLLQEIVKHGVFLVPVGHKLSATEPLEWRISASLAERCLMSSLTIVHIKGYVLLKMLVKTFVEPHVEKCISSYHCKTALFYCTENTEVSFWREDNLIPCVLRCLEMLHAWVTDRFCPHFILHEENLFAGKVTVNNRGILQTILVNLIRRNERALLQIHLDDLGQKLTRRFSTKPSVMPVLDTLATSELLGYFEINMHETINGILNELILLDDKNIESIPLINFVRQKIDLLKDSIKQSDKHERQAIKVLIEFLSCWLGSLQASGELSDKRKISRPMTLQLLRNWSNDDVASMLKRVSILYCNGDLCNVDTALQSAEARLSCNITTAICKCYSNTQRPSREFQHAVYALKGRKARAKLIAHCVKFSTHEMHCAPPALRTELYRSIGDDIQHRDPYKDEWMDLAVVDCLPFLYFLQYMIFMQLGKQDLQSQALNNLDRCVREDRGFCHLETAWNLLGQCYEFELKPDAAMACYRTSLRIRPRNNAAKWHIAILCYRLIQQI